MTCNNRRICIVTGSRAEYGLLVNLMREIDDDPALTLQIVVTAMHIEEAFGNTAALIKNDGFSINARVPMELSDAGPVALAGSLAKGVAGMAAAFHNLLPDVIVVLGDRLEILAAAEAALLMRIPVAHVHGGEASEGVFDESIRHSVTKMSHLHFTAAESYRQRVIQLGEQPSRVFNVGALCLDVLATLPLMDRDELSSSMNINVSDPFFLVTYHPVTLSEDDPGTRVGQMLDALDRFPGYNVIITGVNADPGHGSVERVISDRVEVAQGRLSSIVSLGQTRYLNTMKFAAAVVGNSSSGLIEAPALKVPTVNIGERQRGRIRADSVIDCDETTDEIALAISNALSPAHAKRTRAGAYPFGSIGASKKIKHTLSSFDLNDVLMKPFYDLAFEARL